jgi:hypothetical protein
MAYFFSVVYFGCLWFCTVSHVHADVAGQIPSVKDIALLKVTLTVFVQNVT